MKYGHTMIRVVDPSHNLDVAYNWGMFDFRTPGFVMKFLRGLLQYHLGIPATRFEVGISQNEHRWLVQERLNLTDRQKAALLKELNREAQPDRRTYRYLFFKDNCSTRPRDVIDRVLGGKIAARFQGKPSGATFRDEVMEYNASAPILAMGQDVILNGEVDRGISQWEEMFAPLKLRDYLLSMPAYNDDGTERPGEKLLTGTTTLVSYPDPVSAPYSGYAVVWLLLGIPVLAGMALYARPAFRETGIRIFGLVLAVWGAVSGGFGLYLTLSWAFSEHAVVVGHNANLWVFWPIDWYLSRSGSGPPLEGGRAPGGQPAGETHGLVCPGTSCRPWRLRDPGDRRRLRAIRDAGADLLRLAGVSHLRPDSLSDGIPVAGPGRGASSGGGRPSRRAPAPPLKSRLPGEAIEDSYSGDRRFACPAYRTGSS